MSSQRWERIKLVMMRIVQKDMQKHKHDKLAKRLKRYHGVSKTPVADWQIVRGDLVEVIRGRDEGKQGKVLRVYRRGECCVVDGVNLRLHKTKGSAGELITSFKPSKVLIKNLALVDQDTNLPTKIEWKYQQTAIDTERYQRVRQSVISGDILAKPNEAKVKRKIREVHPEKDTPTRLANVRTWVGPWEFFTEEQKQFIIEDSREKIDLPNLSNKLPELIYNNVEEVEFIIISLVQEYIKMLPYCSHSFFKPGNCAPFQYEKPFIRKWSNRRMKKELKLEDGKRDHDREDLKEQLSTYERTTFPWYLTRRVDADHYWPRVRPEIDPKFKHFHRYLREHCDEDEVMRLLEEEFVDDDEDENGEEIEDEQYDEEEKEQNEREHGGRKGLSA